MMKKTFFLTAAVVLTVVFAGCSKKDAEAEAPDAPDGLGKISFATTKTWKISGNGVTQTWSDAVVATGANGKTIFDGGPDFGPFKADWRNNPGYKGSLFSWEAVNKYQDYLCPKGWRVPTKNDAINLDKILGGTGSYQSPAAHRDNYLSEWGGELNGRCMGNGAMSGTGESGLYWTQSTASGTERSGDDIGFGSGAGPGALHKYSGLAVRCVK